MLLVISEKYVFLRFTLQKYLSIALALDYMSGSDFSL